MTVREKKIKSLQGHLQETHNQLQECRKLLRNKTKDNVRLLEEVHRWKKTMGNETENIKSLKRKLEDAKSVNSTLQSELKLVKSQYRLMVKARDKFEAQCKQMENTREYREIHNQMLSNQQELFLSKLKVKDQQLEKVAKKKKALLD
ncbi:uncharacterized protein CEXT_275451 [Caerostris extrusa]|uniref:Nucleoporin NSP1-like C-terminal domain-containing protein n=1 Tax=Caerostris extrusa TaxID=172846 RepID=A0AAV4VSJ4_CAEEX|nr:uncharacterized protein CEXT_275451 [Caerostris extrusa]